MGTPHISAPSGSIAETVLLPGDPLRARFIAETYLQDSIQCNGVRNMLAFTGTWQGKPVSVMGSGMGMPSLAIYTEELIRSYGVKRIIRVGSCGALQPELQVYDIVIAVSSCTDSAFNDRRFRGATYAATADFRLAMRAWEITCERGIRPYAGPILATDIFYGVEGEDLPWQLWAKYGVLAVEMESTALYTLAARNKVQALSILTVSDSLVDHQSSTPEERERSFSTMAEIALALAIE